MCSSAWTSRRLVWPTVISWLPTAMGTSPRPRRRLRERIEPRLDGSHVPGGATARHADRVERPALVGQTRRIALGVPPTRPTRYDGLDTPPKRKGRPRARRSSDDPRPVDGR